ncbi:hypothetical protein H9P43_001718 [Blastocladiella emersonii ATCC 22665]|nr:hypothetical protein H9P43_001718 [Blastocladiella emersonii ATCC 22665]
MYLLRFNLTLRNVPQTLRSCVIPAANMSSTHGNNSGSDAPANNNTESGEQLALPWRDTAGSASGPTVEVNGDATRLTDLGPMVVNVDGTMSRIENWAEMSEFEKASVMRIIPKRNRQRREALLRAQQEAAAAEEEPKR